jgi:hypothetical protein
MSQRADPHAEAAYWVIPLDKEAFAVEVITPWNYPTTVSTFASAADAKAWIAAHRRRGRHAYCLAGLVELRPDPFRPARPRSRCAPAEASP